MTGSTGVPGFGDGSLYTTEDEKDLLSPIITTLNKTYGLNLTEEDKVDMQHIRTKLKANEGLQVVLNTDNPRDAKVYKFNRCSTGCCWSWCIRSWIWIRS